MLPGVWQVPASGGVFDFEEMSFCFCPKLAQEPFVRRKMKNIKFVVKVNRGGTRAPAYVQRIEPAPIHMTTDRKLALVMGRFTAEDAIKSLQNSHCIPELESVQVSV